MPDKEKPDNQPSIRDLLTWGLDGRPSSRELWVETCRDALRAQLAEPVDLHTPAEAQLHEGLGSFSVSLGLTHLNGPTLQEALRSPEFSPAMLRGIARRAKRLSRQANNDVERAIQRAIYFAAIAAGLNHYGCRITRLSADEVAEALQHLRQVEWLVPVVVELIDQALTSLR